MGASQPQPCSAHDPTAAARRIALSPAQVESVAGLTAGSIATLVVHPLDIVKTRMQSAFLPP